MNEKTGITVNGRRYLVSCEPGRVARLQLLGEKLDTRMRALSKTLGEIGNERLFLALGLSILDELEEAERHTETGDTMPGPSERRATRTLTDIASRIEAIVDRLENVQ